MTVASEYGSEGNALLEAFVAELRAALGDRVTVDWSRGEITIDADGWTSVAEPGPGEGGCPPGPGTDTPPGHPLRWRATTRPGDSGRRRRRR